jgi:hypothetical protein
MWKPRLRITEEAKEALRARIASSTLAEPRPTILWAIDGRIGGLDIEAIRRGDKEALRRATEAGKWCVAFYDGKTLSWFHKCTIEGLPFCFVQLGYRRRLNGATLTFTNGKFEVNECAI